MSDLITPTPDDSVVYQSKGKYLLEIPWKNWTQRVYNILFAVTQSGTTANRPTKLLWVGRTYFDTSLNKPIWLRSVGPIVWVDATGASV